MSLLLKLLFLDFNNIRIRYIYLLTLHTALLIFQIGIGLKVLYEVKIFTLLLIFELLNQILY